MRRALLLAVVLALLGASEAGAHTAITCDPCSYPYQPWVDEAKVPTPDVTLAVVESADMPCIGPASGCTTPGGYAVWMNPEVWGRGLTVKPRTIFLHELGHNVDFYVLPAWMRTRYMALVGGQPPWEPGTPISEDFAWSYALCAIRPYIRGSHTYNKVCRMLTRLPGARSVSPISPTPRTPGS